MAAKASAAIEPTRIGALAHEIQGTTEVRRKKKEEEEEEKNNTQNRRGIIFATVSCSSIKQLM